MTEQLSIALAQINPTVGDLNGNRDRIVAAYRQGAAVGADLVICPELVLSGYPPEDLVRKGSCLATCRRLAEEIAGVTAAGGPGLIFGTPWLDDPHRDHRPYNAVLLAEDGGIRAIRYKCHLPNYGVFDEPRRYRAGDRVEVTPFRGVTLGLMVCEDMWYPDISAQLKGLGAEILIAPHGSPFRMTAHGERLMQAEARMAETGLPLVFVNQAGGQDELVFDGGAFSANRPGARFQAPLFDEGLYLTRWEKGGEGWQCTEGPQAELPEDDALAYSAVVLGTRDYINKNRFPGVVLGLSGGIDSALVAAIAVDALGPERVHAIMMPSRYTAGDSVTDAEDCARRLGIRYDTIAIRPGFEAFNDMLAPLFAGRAADVTEENLQSRIRGTLLMAVSNKFGSMVLTTGNKSEMAVGYATLYGDMNGGFNPLKDLYKTRVYALAAWRNGIRPAGALGPEGAVIPENILTKAPSAELREDQTDQDSLPPYEDLDEILHGLVEEELSVEAICARGQDRETVLRVQHLLYIAEYKRRQAAPGPKITSVNFGRDRRYPITNGFRDK